MVSVLSTVSIFRGFDIHFSGNKNPLDVQLARTLFQNHGNFHVCQFMEQRHGIWMQHQHGPKSTSNVPNQMGGDDVMVNAVCS